MTDRRDRSSSGPHSGRPDAGRPDMLDRIRLLAAALVDVGDLAEAVDLVAAQLVAALELDGVMVTRLRTDGRVELAGSLGAPDAMVAGFPRALIDDVPTTDVIRYGSDIWVPSRVSWVERFPELAARTSQIAAGNVPIEVGGRVIGALSLIVDDDRSFTDDERRFIETMSVLLAGVVSRIVESPSPVEVVVTAEHEAPISSHGPMEWAPTEVLRGSYRVPLLVQMLVGHPAAGHRRDRARRHRRPGHVPTRLALPGVRRRRRHGRPASAPASPPPRSASPPRSRSAAPLGTRSRGPGPIARGSSSTSWPRGSS